MLQLSKLKVANLVKLLILIENVEMYDLRTEKYPQINLRCNIACNPTMALKGEIVPGFWSPI